jgi:hypothetical protein
VSKSTIQRLRVSRRRVTNLRETVCARQPPRKDLGEAVEQEREELVRVILRAHVRIKREEARGLIVAPAGVKMEISGGK